MTEGASSVEARDCNKHFERETAVLTHEQQSLPSRAIQVCLPSRTSIRLASRQADCHFAHYDFLELHHCFDGLISVMALGLRGVKIHLREYSA